MYQLLLNNVAFTSKNLFNAEVKTFRDQYWRTMNLVEYLEKTVKEQTHKIAYQEMIIEKLSNRLYGEQFDQGAAEFSQKELDQSPEMDHESRAS